jgi:hypothetical protein
MGVRHPGTQEEIDTRAFSPLWAAPACRFLDSPSYSTLKATSRTLPPQVSTTPPTSATHSKRISPQSESLARQ